MSHHSFVSKFLQEISIIITCFLFELATLKMPLICSYLLSIFSLVTLEKFALIKKCMIELMKSINTLTANLLRCDLALSAT